MSKLGKKIVAAGLCVGLVFGTMTGCSSSNAGKAVAVLDGENIDYALVNFTMRFNQAEMQSMYGSMFGEDMWSSYGESTKSGIVDSIEEQMILEKHMDEYNVVISDEDKAKITEAAAKFMESNDEDVLEAMTASQEIIERMLTLNLIQTRMRAAIIADVDTEVTDEEAAQKTVKYVMFSTADTTDEDGNAVAMTDEEKAEAKTKAETVLEAVKAGTDMDEAAQAVEESLTSSSTSYGTDNGTIDEAVKTAVDSLGDGEIADTVIEGESGYYVAQMVSTFDEAATETQKETIVSQRQSDKYNEVYEGWKEAAEFTTDADLLADIDFIDTFEVKATETETETGSETTTETVSETETTAETETETAAETETTAETATEAAAETEAVTE